MSISYADAGVDIDAGDEAVTKIKGSVKSTHSPAVLTDLGGFGGAYDLKELLSQYKNPVLVQSTDSVGTKVMVAAMKDDYSTIGRDLVSNVVGDILVMGAKPLTFLDYLAYNKINPDRIAQIVEGIAHECKESGMSLVGGEMAELPGVYRENETDIVGFVTGIVERDSIITGKNIAPGDVILGFASSGIHTNGFSLARKIMFEIGGHAVENTIEELGCAVGEEMLRPHLNYSKPILGLLDAGMNIKGMAHITGGGLLENIPRILPDGTAAQLTRDSWPVLPVFSLMQSIGDIEEMEMYRTFNMGVGMVLVVSADDVEAVTESAKQYPDYTLHNIGTVVEGEKKVILT